ncbi:MAG: MBL fold metallo-hydrolase [Clostridia bacterium]|nr:MBL fold metallo-hydrolase [Clostridia bacterium]
MKITDYRIVISKNALFNERRAASFIRENVKLVCGKKIPIVYDVEEPTPLEIVVGRTSREVLDGLSLERSESGIWEFLLKKLGDRLYLTGLGVEPEDPPYTSAYQPLNDGAVGTALAAYHFVERILGYDFIYSAFEDFPESPELEMPEEYNYVFTRDALRRIMPEWIDGASIHSLNCTGRIDYNIGSFIIKTKEGRIIVIDGGRGDELPRLIESLKVISGEEVPTVTAWLFSHLHDDHYGAYVRLTEDEWRNKIKVLDVYCDFISRAHWEAKAFGSNVLLPGAYDAIMGSDKTLGASIHVVKKGDRISVDEVSFDVIHVPDPSHASQMNVNDTTTIYKMTYDNGQTIMFLGDAEWVCNEDLIENCADLLKSDVVQVGHHGCGNVSKRCYELIDAKAYIWQCGLRFWYQEKGEGVNTHNVGLVKYRTYMMERGIKKENIYLSIDKIDSLPLPIPIY